MKIRKEIELIKDRIKYLDEKVDILRKELAKQRIVYPCHHPPFCLGYDQSFISLPSLQDKIDALLNHLNLEYKYIKDHHKLIEKEESK